MKFKKFISWCSDRAADGCWDYTTATYCINIIEEVSKERWWRREKYWRKNYEKSVIKDVIIPIEERIDSLKSVGHDTAQYLRFIRRLKNEIRED